MHYWDPKKVTQKRDRMPKFKFSCSHLLAMTLDKLLSMFLSLQNENILINGDHSTLLTRLLENK